MSWLARFRAEPESESFDTPAPQVNGDRGRIERGSETWLFVSQHARSEIDRLREKNDSNKLDLVMTAEIRGQIKALKRLIALGQPKADKPAPEDD